HLVGGRGDAAVIFEGEIDAKLPGVRAGFLDSVHALPTGAFLLVVLRDSAGEDADGLAAQPAGVLDPAFDVVDLLLEARGVVNAEIVADRRAADIKAEPGAAPFELAEIRRRGLREIILGEFDGVEGHRSGEVDEAVVGHSWRFSAQIE